MKYTVDIVVEKPLDRVIELFDNEDNLKEWQEGLQSFEHLSGEKGMPGAKSRLRFKMGKREIEMIETVTVRDLPKEFSGTYEADGVWNEVRNYFEAVDENSTKWRSECEFRFTSIFMKIMGFLMPGAFKKQSLKYMKDFKTFAESQ